MKERKVNNYLIAIAVTAVIIIGSIILIKKIGIDVGEQALKVNGIFGTTVMYNQIEKLDLLSEFPQFGTKIVGVDLYFLNYGIYTYSGYGKVRLFEISKQKPYLIIKLKDETIVIAMGKLNNEEYYNKIKINMLN
jgi:hypothetical protein